LATPSGDASPVRLGRALGDSDPETASLPPDLAAVAKAWPTLPGALKAGIVAMVKAAGDSPKA